VVRIVGNFIVGVRRTGCKRLWQQDQRNLRFFTKYSLHINPFQLPKLVKHQLYNPDKSIWRKKYVASKKAIEAVGTKNFFGHTKNLPYTKAGFMVSKSSINLNKL
jgi:hypothetical protein